jgi:toxin FitB
VDDVELAISALTVREVRKGIDRLRLSNAAKADQIDARATDAFDAFGERILPITRDVADIWAARGKRKARD